MEQRTETRRNSTPRQRGTCCWLYIQKVDPTQSATLTDQEEHVIHFRARKHNTTSAHKYVHTHKSA